MMGTRRPPLPLRVLKLLTVLAVPPVIAIFGLIAFVEHTSHVPDGYKQSLAATIHVESSDGSTNAPTWGTTLGIDATEKSPWASRSYSWQYSLDQGTTWEDWDPKTKDSETMPVTAAMVGSLWRCAVTDEFTDGSVTATSEPYGPIEPRPYDLAPRGKVVVSLEPGYYLFVDADAPKGTALSYRWQRAPAAGSTYEDVKVTETGTYFIRREDTGYRFRCIVGGVLEGYALTGGVVTFDGVVENPRDLYTLPSGTDEEGGGASGGSSKQAAPASAVAYVCDSAADGLYHAYDCDTLSHLREQGFSVQELPLDQARRLYRSCPYCQGGA